MALPADLPSLRRPISTLLLALALLTAAAPAAAQSHARGWSIAPPAAWVRALSLPATDRSLESSAGGGRLYLLVDHQVRAGAVTSDYRRYAWTALSTAGVQNASEIQMDFDPEFERLVIHHVRLLRDGRDVFSFRPSDVRVIQQERGLDEQIYSGQLTAVVFLRDLRPGDTLDYSYSIEGANPILGGGFDDELPLAYDAPVRLVRHVLQVPAGTRLTMTPRHTGLTPQVETAGGWTSYTWSARDVAASIADEDEPAWFDPGPRVAVSTFASWGEVADWARALFEAQLRPSAEVTRLAEQFRSAAPGSVRAAAAEATRFVQDEVRYLGIEMGPSSHQPHAPEQVLRQRFGDCKDKSLLLVALLRSLGVDAAPALVDTERRHGLDEEPPSPFAFDHAIVRAVIEGREVWIDATESDMGGPLERRDPPEFERALVLRPGEHALTAIPAADTRDPSVVVKETFTLVGGDIARLEVVTTFRGTDADEMRRRLATTPAQELAKTYLDDYARDDAEIKALAAPRVEDDRGRNVLVVAESYEVPSFWKKGKRELRGWEVEDHLPRRVAATRATPLVIPHPVHVRHEVIVRADRAFRLGPLGEHITAHAFEFTSALARTGHEIKLEFDYRTLADSVRPEEMKAHLQAMERLDDALSIVLLPDLTSPDAPEQGWAEAPVIGSTLAFGTAAALAVAAGLRARRRRARQAQGSGSQT